ncbi:hypothetical protein [Streptococcus mutans]|nr:hypothetical protein [Streptococcus mutans]
MADKRIFCEHCLDDVPFHIENRELTRKLKGKDYTFKCQEAVCDNCKQPVFVTEIDKANREALYACFKADDLSEYVQAHGLTISEFARQAMLEK